jgi:hypothetical protein
MDPLSEITEEESRLIAQWGGEAAKAWWTQLNDEERARFGANPPEQLFVLGWQAARLTDFKARQT